MRFIRYILCLIIGHNKVLQTKKYDMCYTYFSICTQCNKKWFDKHLSEKLPELFKIHTLSFITQGQTAIIPGVEKKKINKIFGVNFYVL
jgi:hypothetical protein